jgi:regulator of replication initiation timing
MRIIRTLIIILTLQVFPSLAQDTTALSTFSLSYDNNTAKLIIEYNVNYAGKLINKDTTKTKSVFDKFFGGIAVAQERKVLTVSGLKAELIKLISNNVDLKLEPEFPKDVLQIIDLIKGKKKKEMARQIYINENPEKLISSNESTCINAKNGYFTKTITVLYTCRIIVGKKTSLNIPAFLLLLDDKTFQTKPMTISL